LVGTDTLTCAAPGRGVEVIAGVDVKRGMAVMVASGVCVTVDNSGKAVGVGDSSPVTGIPGSDV
jgi:hypothetical protein